MSASSPSPARARLGISLLFFTNGFALSNLLPRYPEIMQTFGLTNTQFGVLIAMYPVGALVASWLPAPLIRRFGAAPTAFGSTAVLTVALLSQQGEDGAVVRPHRFLQFAHAQAELVDAFVVALIHGLFDLGVQPRQFPVLVDGPVQKNGAHLTSPWPEVYKQPWPRRRWPGA